MVTCSFLPRELMGSSVLGRVMYGKIARPLLLWAQVLSHSIFVFDFIICLQVLRDTGRLGCSWDAPSLASLSADSFPGMSQWLGIHWSVTFTENSSIKFEIASLRSLMDLVVCLSLSIAWRTDLESEKITISVVGVFFAMFLCVIWCSAASIASVSASKFEQRAPHGLDIVSAH